MAEVTEKPSDPYTLMPDTPQTVGTEELDATVDEAAQPSMTWMLLRELVETVVLSLVIFLLIRQVVQNYRIESLSMEPNFYEGQFILVNKLAYRLGSPERGDVIVFHNPRNGDEDYIKRVIGLPGDTVQVRNQTVVVNGVPLEEPYLPEGLPLGPYFDPVVVESNHLFVMGDNRPNSEDSRAFGQLPEELIVGRAWLRVWPFSVFGLVKHYDLDSTAPVSLVPIPATQ